MQGDLSYYTMVFAAVIFVLCADVGEITSKFPSITIQMVDDARNSQDEKKGLRSKYVRFFSLYCFKLSSCCRVAAKASSDL